MTLELAPEAREEKTSGGKVLGDFGSEGDLGKVIVQGVWGWRDP